MKIEKTKNESNEIDGTEGVKPCAVEMNSIRREAKISKKVDDIEVRKPYFDGCDDAGYDIIYSAEIASPRKLLNALRASRNNVGYYSNEIYVNGQRFHDKEIHALYAGCETVAKAENFLENEGSAKAWEMTLEQMDRLEG